MNREERHQGLQALRGIAVLLVFAQHIFWQANLVRPGPTDFLYSLNLGGVGVFVFFALSAFLISGKAADPPGKFLVDRARRILPGLWISLLIAALIGDMLIGIHGLTWQVFLLLPFGDKPPVTIPYWTLYFESLLYAVIFVVARISPRIVGPAIICWAVAAWIWQDRPYGNGHYLFPTWYHLLFPVFAVYFAAGVFASFSSSRPVDARWRRPIAIGYAALATLMFATPQLFAIPEVLRGIQLVAPWLPTDGDIVFFAFAAGAYFALRGAMNWGATGRIGQVLRRFGDMSYGIYLIHIPFMYLGGHFLKKVGAPQSYVLTACILTAFALPLSMIFGWLEFRMQGWLKARLYRFAIARLQGSNGVLAMEPRAS